MLCKYYQSVFSINHGGRSDIDNDWEPQKHKFSVETAIFSTRVTHFFKTAYSDEPLLLAAKEASFAYHAALHGESFKSSDCTSNPVSNFFKPKFAIARTKCELMVINCIAPMVAA